MKTKYSNPIIRKVISTLFLVCVMFLPLQVRATIGGIAQVTNPSTVSLVTTIVGGGLTLAGLTGVPLSLKYFSDGLNFVGAGLSVVVAGVGLVTLDSDGNPIFQMNYINPAAAEQFSLSDEESSAVNRQLDLINSVFQSVQETVFQDPDFDTKSESELLLQSANVWSQYMDSLQPQSRSALAKIFSF